MFRVHSRSFRAYALTGVLNLSVMVGAGGAALFGTQAGATAPDRVVREVFATGAPAAASGQQLQLVRYVIQPGTTLPPHRHPGMQIARIESGTMRYTLVAGGETPVFRHGEGGQAGPAEVLQPGDVTVVHPGDTLIEAENVVHYGANVGEEPVVIWVAALLERGQPPAIVEVPSR